jgi:hypothetical protein
VEDQESQIVIDDVVEKEEQGFSIEGLTEEEVELAKKHQLIKEEEEKEDGELPEQPEPTTEEDTGSEEDKEEKEEEVDTDPDNFDAMDSVFEKNEEKFHKTFSSNQKALYFKSKRDKQLRQEAVKELEELKASAELNTLKESVSGKKLSAIKEALADPDLTVEKLQAIIDGQAVSAPKEKEVMTREEYEALRKKEEDKQRVEHERFTQRVKLAEQIGKSKYDKFDDIANLAQEVVNEDKTGVYQKVLSEAFRDINIDEDVIVDTVVRVAQMSPKFKDAVVNASPSDREKVDRAIKNSKKPVSSASLSGSGRRVIANEDDLTPEDAVKMNNKQWMKLKESTRRRLLGGG